MPGPRAGLRASACAADTGSAGAAGRATLAICSASSLLSSFAASTDTAPVLWWTAANAGWEAALAGLADAAGAGTAATLTAGGAAVAGGLAAGVGADGAAVGFACGAGATAATGI